MRLGHVAVVSAAGRGSRSASHEHEVLLFRGLPEVGRGLSGSKPERIPYRTTSVASQSQAKLVPKFSSVVHARIPCSLDGGYLASGRDDGRQLARYTYGKLVRRPSVIRLTRVWVSR